MARMRNVLLIGLLLTQSADAIECFIADSDRPLILRGVVEYHHEPGKRGFSFVLHLESPICIQGATYGGRRFKKEGISAVLLGIPANLNKGLRDGEHVVLRGKIGAPAVNDPKEDMTFGLLEVQ